MKEESKLAKYTVEEMLDELARRCSANVEQISTFDLISELTTRKGVDVTIVDPFEFVRHSVEGPAIILTWLD